MYVSPTFPTWTSFTPFYVLRADINHDSSYPARFLVTDYEYCTFELGDLTVQASFAGRAEWVLSANSLRDVVVQAFDSVTTGRRSILSKQLAGAMRVAAQELVTEHPQLSALLIDPTLVESTPPVAQSTRPHFAYYPYLLREPDPPVESVYAHVHTARLHVHLTLLFRR